MYKIWRSNYNEFSAEPLSDLEEETCHADEVYTDEILHEIAENGFNGIWVHCFMHHIAAAPPLEILAPHAGEHQTHADSVNGRNATGSKCFCMPSPSGSSPKRITYSGISSEMSSAAVLNSRMAALSVFPDLLSGNGLKIFLKRLLRLCRN